MIFSNIKKNRIPLEKIEPKDSRLTDFRRKSISSILTCAEKAVHKTWLLLDFKDNILHGKIKNKQEEQVERSIESSLIFAYIWEKTTNE